MDGDNKYSAEDFGYQKARKGIKFLSLPPVLFIQLKRFEYDYNREIMIKVSFKVKNTPLLLIISIR